MAITPLATLTDYEARYGEAKCPTQVSTLLADATAYIMGQSGFAILDETDPRYELQQANLVTVTCAVVHRSVAAGDLAGLSSYSQSAVGISSSVSVYNPGGDMYLTKSERKLLGIGGSRVGTVYAAIHGPCGEVVWPCESTCQPCPSS